MTKVVYPWDDSGFKGSVEDRRLVYEYLWKQGYPVAKMKEPLAQGILDPIEWVLKLLFSKKWVFVISSSNRLLQALANACPIAYALTTMETSFNVDTKRLLTLYARPEPKDDFQVDVPGEVLHRIDKAGLLVWENINVMSSGATKVEANFVSLLSRRMTRSLPMLMTASYRMSPVKLERVLDQVERALGSTVVGMISENSVFRDFVVEGGEIAMDKVVV